MSCSSMTNPRTSAVFEAACAGRFSVLTATTGRRGARDPASDGRRRAARRPAHARDERARALEHARPALPEVVRMLVTAYSDLQTAVGAINRGQVRRYLKKPWDHDELLSTLGEAVEYHDMRSKPSALERRLVETERVYSLGVISSGLARELRAPVGSICASVARARSLLRPVADSLVDGHSLAVGAQGAARRRRRGARRGRARQQARARRRARRRDPERAFGARDGRRERGAPALAPIDAERAQGARKPRDRPPPGAARRGLVGADRPGGAEPAPERARQHERALRTRRKLVVRLFTRSLGCVSSSWTRGQPLSGDFGKQAFDPLPAIRWSHQDWRTPAPPAPCRLT